MYWLTVPELNVTLAIGILGIFVWLFPHLAGIAAILFFLVWMIWIMFTVKTVFQVWKKTETVTKFSILGIFILFLVGLIFILFPEKGFDALWYHLPLTELLLHNASQAYIPELYQSAMPRLGSALATMGYVGGALVSQPVAGVRIMFWMISVLAITLAYRLARGISKQSITAVSVLAFCSFQVMGWQLSSAYVDITRLLFECAALCLLMKSKSQQHIFLSGVFLGYAYGVKLVSGLFLPVWLVYAICIGGRKNIVSMMAGFFTTALPWLFYAWIWTGNPVFPLFQSLNGVEQLTLIGVGGWGEWIQERFGRFPLLPVSLLFHAEGYTTPIFLFSMPFLIYQWWIKKWNVPLMWFTVLGLFFWSFLPPLSIRYGLIFFFVWLVCSLHSLSLSRKSINDIGLGLVLVSFFFHLGVRSALFMTEYKQCLLSPNGCLQSQTVGIAVGPFERWYEGYWHAVAHRTAVPAMDSTLQPVVR